MSIGTLLLKVKIDHSSVITVHLVMGGLGSIEEAVVYRSHLSILPELSCWP